MGTASLTNCWKYNTTCRIYDSQIILCLVISAFYQLIPDDMEEFRTMMAQKSEAEYPEMKREITIFILMTVSGKREYRVIEKLYALPEVREVHAVHGNVDIIVKAVLTRDLLSSDAEVISYFVNDHIRQIHGIVNTQTLIPGLSKVKDRK